MDDAFLLHSLFPASHDVLCEGADAGHVPRVSARSSARGASLVRACSTICVALGLAVLALAQPTLAADADEPHPHQGKVKPIGIPPTQVDLTAAEVAALERGEPVHKQTRGDGGGRGIAVLDVHAEPAVVWNVITDFAQYPRMVDNVRETSVYARAGEHIKARFVLGGAGVSIEYFVDHVFRPDAGYMTWTLDYSRKSDMDDSVGFWRVASHPTKPGWSRIFYSIEVRVGWWLPGFVEDMLAKDGLKKSTLWARREAERRATQTTPRVPAMANGAATP